jgi:hypothetical protein
MVFGNSTSYPITAVAPRSRGNETTPYPKSPS